MLAVHSASIRTVPSKTKLQAGATILNRGMIDTEGTVGCLVNDGWGKHYALTGQHVYDGLDTIAIGEPGELLASTQCQKVPSLAHKDSKSESDAGALVVPQDCPLICIIDNLDYTSVTTDRTDGKHNPYSIDEDLLIQLCKQGTHVVRHNGAVSGQDDNTRAKLTGFFTPDNCKDGIKILVKSDYNSEAQPQFFNNVLEATPFPGTNKHFMEHGDSGSLWYLEINGAIVPIGISLATVEATGKSYAMFISHCFEKLDDAIRPVYNKDKEEDIKVPVLQFCSQETCGVGHV